MYEKKSNLYVAKEIVDFVDESLQAENISKDAFWSGVDEIIAEFAPRNKELLTKRALLQQKIDAWHKENPGKVSMPEYKSFLTDIGYIEKDPGKVNITTQNVDFEISNTAAPQLVVPLLNARFAINAANARWGSLYDALYGSDVIDQSGELAPGSSYNPKRGELVIAFGREFLNSSFPLKHGSHEEVKTYSVESGNLVIKLHDNSKTTLSDETAFAGFSGPKENPESILLKHNNLHVEICIDPHGSIGATDKSGIQDIIVEAAVTTIMDLEDSIAAVDAKDKALGYKNWRGIINGTLTEEVTKAGKTFTRKLNKDKQFLNPQGEEFLLSGRSVLFVRNVGHLMTTDIILNSAKEEVPEGIVDGIMTVLGALGDIRGEKAGYNSKTGSIYIVKPKMHGSAEVKFTDDLFERVEQLFKLPKNTLKIGIMDEERRTSINLASCIAAAEERIVFINTGFLDRTGDEIHTSMWAGPMLPKAEIRGKKWLDEYEFRNVAIGLNCGLAGKAQIGKGMWAMPDLMKDMMQQKIKQVEAGASTAWVPSPTAATLHALHYHQVNAFEARKQLPQLSDNSLEKLLEIPLADKNSLTEEVVLKELDNNVQSILGYVVRWIDQGVGCSKVPDISNVALMEDRATLRISSQLIANWLLHGIVTQEQVDNSLRKLSSTVDQQNASDRLYIPLLKHSGDSQDQAFHAARRLILEGKDQPNGYTEPILHEVRRARKKLLSN